jgi:type IV pilus assembly protein PilE
MKKRQAGITLLELMIVVTIVGILSAIAYPNYRQYAIRSTRTEAKVALQQSAQALEKCFTRYMSYADANCPADATLNRTTADGHYTIAITNRAATTFTLTAAPTAGQVADTECASFVIDQTGAQTITGSGTAATCW